MDGQVVGGVEDFDEKREAIAVGEVFTKDLGAVIFPEFVQGFSGEVAAADDGLGIFSIDDFPGFAVGNIFFRELALVEGFEFSSAPDALHVEGLEGDC